MKTKRTLVAFVALTVVAFGVVIGILGVSNRKQQAQLAAQREIKEQLGNVCNGVGVASASSYRETSGMHPVVYANKTALRFSVDIGYYTPMDLKPSTLGETELVACIVEERVKLEECPYELTNGTRAQLIRVQPQIVVTLRAAQTGEVVATSDTMIGGIARKYERSETFKDGELTKYAAGTRPRDTLDEWIKSYVQVP